LQYRWQWFSERFATFSLGRHERAGADSAVRVVVDDVMGIIHDMVMEYR
jgi:hypothetical protein